MTNNISLKNIPMFGRLSDETLAEVYAALKSRNLKTGEVVFNQGDEGDELIVVEQGEISIFAPIVDGEGTEKPIRIFGPGEVLGEMALIDQKPRSLSARAEKETVILTLGVKEFKNLLSDNPEMAFSVMSGLNERIRYTTDFLSEVRKWVQRVADGDYQHDEIAGSGDKYKDETISSLAAEFAQMTARVQEREDELRKEVIKLQIEVDEKKRKQDVAEILDSDYYRSLKEKAKQMRQRKQD
jgi:CRP-like cAMP-binding protein